MSGGTFKELEDHRGAIAQWMRTPSAVPFFTTLEQWRQLWQKRLETTRDVVDLHRAQGSIEVINKILEWRKEL